MRHYIITLILLVAVSGVRAQEQRLAGTTETRYARFDAVERRNPWNAGTNAAGLRQDTVSQSYAEIYFNKTNGGFMDLSSSDNSWNAGARTQSIRHFKKISFAGGFGYDYFDGRNMCGSVFSRPGYYPIDILEFTPGWKIRENYSANAAVSAPFSEHWTGGLKIDFNAQNYAKRKDLRHKNTMLDFEFAPGVMYHSGAFAIGVNYIIGTNSDKVALSEIGTSPDSYDIFMDRGLRYGTLGKWQAVFLPQTASSGAGLTDLPVKENVQGAGLQLQYGDFYGDIAYRNRQGRIGGNRTYWYDFGTDQLTADVAYSHRDGVTERFVRAHVDWQSQQNRENLILNNNETGIGLDEILGSTPVFERKSLELKVEYEEATGNFRNRVGVEGTWLNRQSNLMYPYVEGQRMNWLTVYEDCLLYFGRWELNLALDYRLGNFTEQETQLAPVFGTPGDYIPRETDAYNYDNEYLTADRLGAAVGLRYNIKRVYIDLHVRYEHGFDLHYIPQPNRVMTTLSVGYNF